MSWLALFFALELGLVPQAGVLMYEPEEVFKIEGTLYTQLEAEVLILNTLFIGGGVRTYVTPGNGEFNFSPNNSVYDFGVGFRFKDTVELGWRHRCFHPSFPYLSFNDRELSGVEGSYDEVYVRFSSEMRRR